MKRILVLENDLIILSNIKDLLSLNNFYVIAPSDAVEGLQLAQQEQPDLILFDVTMQKSEEIDILEALCRNSLTSKIPLILLTSMHTSDYYGYLSLTKPFRFSDLLKLIDISLEKQEIIKKESTEKLEVLRRNITSSLPHELLTPLVGILGTSGCLLDSYEYLSSDEILVLIRNINEHGNRMYRLAQNFITFSELATIEASSKTWQEEFDQTAVKNIIRFAAETSAKKTNRINDLTMNLQEVSINISPNHLSKVVTEIVDNAFKFSKSGDPVYLSSVEDKQFFYLYISDRGRGMTKAQVADIGAFMQFDREHYNQQGCGLGLTIVKQIVKLYGGELSIKNGVFNQTTVSIQLPKCSHIAKQALLTE